MSLSYEYNYLKKSPMFHFSLHAKELFHSNFLAWLGSDVELKPLFKDVMTGLGVDKKFVESWKDDFEVLREKQNIDLIVKAPDSKREAKQSKVKEQTVEGKWYVMIENKVKSIPNEKQLEGYAKKHLDVNEKLLLVIVGEPENLNYGWRRVNYSQMIASLEKGIEKVADPYKKAIIADYVAMTEALIAIVASQEVMMNTKFNFEPSQELNELRIADLVDKWRAAKIAELYSSKTELPFTSGYTNKTPLIEVFETRDNVTFGIQIQGRQYRRVMIDKIGENEIAEKSNGFLSEERKGFRENMLKLYSGVFETRAIQGEENKKFCSYGKGVDGRTFWYQYVTINDDATVEQIMNCIVEDMKLLKNAFNIK